MQAETSVASVLIEWFQRSRRDYPWRNRTDAYSILIAEILLRKTDVAKVNVTYEKFLSKFPAPGKLAIAKIREVVTELKPLGMYKIKARQLRALARQLVGEFDGQVPESKDDLLKLPGVGDYIANTILSSTRGLDLPALDTNGVRILLRVFNLKSSKARPRTDRKLWELAQRMIPPGKGREFNLALLDFGALVCRARKPLCWTCPLGDLCLWPHKVTSN